MSLLDDGSNESLVVALILGSIICAAVSVIRGMRHIDRALRNALDIEGDDTLQLTCPCDGCNAFYGYRPNSEVGKPWWKP